MGLLSQLCGPQPLTAAARREGRGAGACLGVSFCPWSGLVLIRMRGLQHWPHAVLSQRSPAPTPPRFLSPRASTAAARQAGASILPGPQA